MQSSVPQPMLVAAQVEELRGAPLNVGNLEEIIDEKCVLEFQASSECDHGVTEPGAQRAGLLRHAGHERVCNVSVWLLCSCSASRTSVPAAASLRCVRVWCVPLLGCDVLLDHHSGSVEAHDVIADRKPNLDAAAALVHESRHCS